MFTESQIDVDASRALVDELRQLNAQLDRLSSAHHEWILQHFVFLDGRSLQRPGHETECREMFPREQKYRQTRAKLGARRSEVLRELARLKTGIEVAR